MSRRNTTRADEIAATQRAIAGLLAHRQQAQAEHARAFGQRRRHLGWWLYGSTEHEDRLRARLRHLQGTSHA